MLPFAAISLCYFGFVGLFSPYAPLWYQSLGYSTFAIGVGALRAARENGVGIPDEVSLIALHDSDLADYLSPPMTTVS